MNSKCISILFNLLTKSKQKSIASKPMKPKTLTNRPSTSSNSAHQNSRMSISSTVTQPSKYPKCDVKKQHHKQLLNLICINQQCKNRGPICVLCKSSQHSGHTVITLKKFLESVQSCLQRIKKFQAKQKKSIAQSAVLEKQQKIVQMAQKSEQKSQTQQQKQPKKPSTKQQQIENQIIQIIKLKQSMLYVLSVQVNRIADQIRKIEQTIIKQSQSAIQQIKNTSTLFENIASILHQLRQDQFQSAEMYRFRADFLLSMIRCKSKENVQINTDIETNNITKISRMEKNFILNIDQWAEYSIKNLSKLFENNLSLNLKKKMDQKQTELKGTDCSIKFTQQQKIKSIVLINHGKGVKLTDKVPGLAVASGQNLKQKTVRVKITHLSASIFLGVGFKDVIKTNQYKFNPASIGHGTYMIGHNSYTYSHHMKANNMVMKGLSFTSGEQISITITEENIVFTKKSDSKTVALALKKMTQQDWKNLSFCVFLGGAGDQVDIIQ